MHKQHLIVQAALVVPLAVAGMGMAADQEVPFPKSGETSISQSDQAPARGIRLTSLIGSDAYDPQGQKAGKIRDIVLDPQRAKLSYFVLGQQQGLGEKLIALPLGAVTYGSPIADRVYVSVDKKVLDKAPGFDSDKWPSQPSVAYYRSIDAYYGTKLGDLAEQAQPSAQEQTTGAQAAGAQMTPSTDVDWSRRVTKLDGREVISPTGESLGSISDVVLDSKSGNITYAVLKDYRGKLHAVAMDAFAVDHKDEKLVLNTTRDQLKMTPSFDEKHWPAEPDPRWSRQAEGQG